MDYKKLTLKNGLRLILIPDKSTEVVTAMILFKVGSRSESEDIAGISHVLEHMHYKGTKKRPSGFKIAEFIDSIGGEHNAFTGKEYTGYYCKVAHSHLSKAFDFLSDLITNSLFKESDLAKEKHVILQEIDMYEDLPMEMVGSKFEQAIFGKNALGRDIIGYKKTVQAVSKAKLISHRDKYYTSENAVLTLAGNFSGLSDKEIIELAEKYFKLSRKKTAQIPEIEISEYPTDKSNILIKKTEQSHLVIGFKTVLLDHPDYHKLELLAVLLGGSMSSRMFEEIREKRGLAYAVRTSSSNYIESGSIETQAGVLHSKVEEAIEAIIGEYKKVKIKKVSESELNKAKEVMIGKMLIKFEDSEELASHYATDELLLGKIFTPEELIKIYQKITPLDIINTAKKYLTEERLGLAFIGPKFDEKYLKKICNL